MSGLTLAFTIAGYLAIAIFLVGFMARVWKYETTPSPLKIAFNPAPVGATGVVYRMAQEAGLFKSLFNSNKIIWLAGYIFHVTLVIVLIKHTRFFFTVRADIISVKKFVMGLITFSSQAMPGDIIFKMRRTQHLGAAG
ncbi:MAG: hypothetical protein KGZ93_08620 [Actinobacteria bacterium]|jgi:nitrate reductase gamma subunit|nr:hypothetical protein [Actinomycetota bacterium]